MEDKNTRDIILQESLQLFAQKGYAAVSMRDIAASVGIKASSIYYYFKGKQELFDALIQQANEIKDMMRMNFMKALGNVGSVAEEPFVQAGVFFLTGYFQNPQISLLLRVLECERLHNEEADKAWKSLVIHAPLEHQLEVFRILESRNELSDTNLEALAAEYQSIGLLAYFTGDIEQMKELLHRFYQRTFQ